VSWITAPWYARKRWMYRGGRTHPWTRVQNRVAAWLFTRMRPVVGTSGVVLEVRGRTSGRTVRLPLAVLRCDGERYLVSMLGNDAQWVRNVQADGGRAVLVDGTAEPVRLVDVPVAERPPLLRAYLKVAPGARPHVPVDRRAPLSEFARIAADYPVFRVEPGPSSSVEDDDAASAADSITAQ
jgi:hypothetical protein